MQTPPFSSSHRSKWGTREGKISLISALIALIVIFNLFYLGAKPVAVGLFPEPWDKLAHFLVFSLLTALFWIATDGRFGVFIVLAVSLIGAADEIHQIFLPGRSAGLDDLAADIIAALTMFWLLHWLRKLTAKTRSPDPQSEAIVENINR
ncbi:MAG TPA: VanZ family protein [Burkholderiales bacterium]|nr:VanZ family protein [Burkholderiales bacterium]